MASPHFLRLLTELHEATVNRKVEWSETASEDAFRIGLSAGIVRVGTGTDKDGDRYVAALLIDENGRTVESDINFNRSGETAFLWDLFDAARGSALNVGGLVEKMISDLHAGKFRKLPSKPSTEDK